MSPIFVGNAFLTEGSIPMLPVIRNLDMQHSKHPGINYKLFSPSRQFLLLILPVISLFKKILTTEILYAFDRIDV